MNCKKCNAELEEGTKLCPSCGMKVEVKSGRRRKLWLRSAVIAGALLTIALLIFIAIRVLADKSTQVHIADVDDSNLNTTPPTETIIISSPTVTPAVDIDIVTNLSKPIPSLFYIKNDMVYYVSGDTTEHKAITLYPYGWSEFYYLLENEDSSRLLYASNIDYNKADFCADLRSFHLRPDYHEDVKLDSGVNNFTMNQDGSKIFYLKDKELYISTSNKKERIAADVAEFYVSKSGDRLLYRTTNCSLFLYTEEKASKEIDSNAYLQYASEDLAIILYFKEDRLYLQKDGNTPQLIDTGLNVVEDTLINVYDDGSFYYLKPKKLLAADYVNDDLATSDAELKEPKQSDYADQISFTSAQDQYLEKKSRDELRQTLENSDYTVKNVNSLYYYSSGKSTLISDYCSKAWPYSGDTSKRRYYRGREKQVLAYTQLKPDKLMLSEISSYADIRKYAADDTATKVQQGICIEDKALGIFTDGDINQLVYDIKYNRIYYITNYYNKSNRGDLYYAEFDDSAVSESTLYADKVIMYDPYSYIIGDNVVYLKNGKNTSEDFVLYVNNEEIDRKVGGWIYPIKNSDSFVYLSNFGNLKDNYTETLNCYKNGKVIKIADNVTSYCILDENAIAYVTMNAEVGKQLFLYDGTDTRVLIDTLGFGKITVTDFLTPMVNQYYAYHRPTLITE
jgi:hypothetical protein